MPASARTTDHRKSAFEYFFAPASSAKNEAEPSFFDEMLMTRPASKNTRQNSVANSSKKSKDITYDYIRLHDPADGEECRLADGVSRQHKPGKERKPEELPVLCQRFRA